MGGRSLEACTRKLERHVRRVFEARRGLPYEPAEIPWIGGTYRPRAPRKQHVALQQQVVWALRAREWFEHTAPKWAQPLPLREDECEMLLKDADRQNQLLGHYALSLRSMGWNYVTHPPFAIWVWIAEARSR